MESKFDVSRMARAELEEGAALVDHNFSNEAFLQDDLADREILDCKFERCVFAGADFANALFESVTFVDCSFDDCSFAPSDIKSCSFFRVEFNKCRLNESFIDNCTFSESRLLNTEVRTTSITNSLFWKTDLVDVDTATTSFFHNRFYHGRWESSGFLHASFGYNIVRVSESLDSPLSDKGALLSMWSSELYGKGDINQYYDDLLADSWQSLGQGRKNLIALLRNITSKAISTLAAFERYFADYPRNSSDRVRINKEELAFILLVAEDLAGRDELPGATIIHAIQWAQEEILALRQKKDEADRFESLPVLNNFYAKLVLIFETQARKLETARIRVECYGTDVPVQVVATFSNKPRFKFDDVLNQLGQLPSLEIKSNSLTIRSYSGSHHDVIKTTFKTLVAIQVLIYMLDGAILQLIPLKEHFCQLTGIQHVESQNLPTLMNELALPPFLRLPLKDMASYTDSWPFKNDPKLGGLSDLQSIMLDVDTQTDETIA